MRQSKPKIRMGYKGGKLVPVRAYYEGASNKTRMKNKGTQVTGPNSNLSNSLPILQARSRNAIANNANASGARDAYVSNMIGTGIKPQWNNETLQTLWDCWAKECDLDGLSCFYGLQSLAAGAQFEAGEVFAKFRYRRIEDGFSVPLQLQLIESEQLDPAFHKVEGDKQIKMGIEFNALGIRTSYHLWKYHPNERQTLQLNQRVAVPAKDVIHLFHRTRPGQIRGLPELTSVIVRLYEIDEMQDAVLARQKLAQLFGAFVKRKTNQDPDDTGPYFGALVKQEGEIEPISEFSPGAIHYLEDDEEITFSDPPDIGSSYTQWLKTEMLAVAKGAGVTYEQLTGDLSDVNYSSIRAGLLEFRRRIEALQSQLIVHQWCRKIAAKWLDVAVASGAAIIPDYEKNKSKLLAIDWIAPKWSWVDPLKEVTADLIEVRAGFKPRSEAAGERGWSLEMLDKEIAKGNQSADENKLLLDSDPRQLAKNGALQTALEILNEDEENS